MTQFDITLRPQDDFFGYVNNPWLADNPIPASESSWGTFYILRDDAVSAVRDILDELAEASPEALSRDQQLLRDMYRSALTFENNQPAHATTLRQDLAAIAAIESSADLATYLGSVHRAGFSPFWSPYVGLDDKDSSVEVLRLYQAGLSLPNRDYYLDSSQHFADIRAKYETFYGDALALLGHSPNSWQQTITVENRLAEYAWTDVELRDVQKNYTKLTQAELRKQLGDFDWDAYFAALGWHDPSDHFVIDQLSYISSCVDLLKTTPLDDIKAYLSWYISNRSLTWFSKEAGELKFAFYGTTINGVKEQKPLWKRASLLMDDLVVGELVGREYVARYFPESSKQAVSALVEEVRSAYHARIDRLDWMSEQSKQHAHRKLDNIRVFVGDPSVWKDFSTLSFGDNLLENLRAAAVFETDLELAKVGQPPAEEAWEMHAHTVNAYNHPNRLEIVFPAAILQPPFFDPSTSHAVNLGGIGAVIGHELTHGFDDQGSEFDEHGKANVWQTEEERRAFFERAENIVRQADKFETVPGVFLQGKLILGEAIADVGGLELAIEALKNSGEMNDQTLQDLFVNFARCECGQATTERLVQLAKIDPHPPSAFRVNCVVNHIDEFYEHYDIQPGDELYLPPADRARIW